MNKEVSFNKRKGLCQGQFGPQEIDGVVIDDLQEKNFVRIQATIDGNRAACVITVPRDPQILEDLVNELGLITDKL